MQYTISKADADAGILHSEVKAQLSGLLSVSSDGGNVVLEFSSALSAGDESTLNSIVSAHSPALQLEKAKRIKEVDYKTDSLIAAGFVYDSQTFSLSVAAQATWIGLKQAADAGLITFPTEVSTKDDGSYSIADAAELTAFYATGVGTVQALIASGRPLKASIAAAADLAALALIEDNR